MTHPVRDAATVLLLRPAEGGFEIFMVRRSGKSRFMPDAMVFPGGRLDDADGAAATLSRCDLSPEAGAARLGCEHGLALLVAGLRETFEEAGVLLANGPDGAPLTFSGEEAARLERRREALNKGECAFSSILEEMDLTLRTSACQYVAHWITPDVEPRRYDTRFLMVEAPLDQAPSHDGHETTAGAWMSPAQALASCEAGEILLAPPTLRVLLTLAPLRSVAEALALREGVMPPTIQPQALAEAEAITLVMPGDPDFVGGGVEPGGLDRFVLRGKRWRSEGRAW